MDWHLTKHQDRVLLGDFGTTSAFSTNIGKHVTGLLASSLKKEYPFWETPRISSTFVNCFVTVHGNFPYHEFQPLGWVHSSTKGRWSILPIFILKRLENQLMEMGLYRTVMAIQHGLPFSRFYFFSTLELHNLETETFFTSVGEMGLAFHELYKISALVRSLIKNMSWQGRIASVRAQHVVIYGTY